MEDEKSSTRKIYKSYDMITLNLMLIKMASNVFIDNDWFNIFKTVVNDGFDRKYDHDITNISNKKSPGNINNFQTCQKDNHLQNITPQWNYGC